MTTLNRTDAWKVASAMVPLSLVLVACSGSGNDPTTVNGNVPFAYVQRVNTIGLNPTSAAPTAPGGDLMIQAVSSPSAPTAYNVTQGITQGVGDVSDPRVSFDGTKIVFAMNCPTSNTATTTTSTGAVVPACTGHWNIWEYVMNAGGFTGGTLHRVTDESTCTIPGGCDDVGPAYLPASQGFVFSSNRQAGEYATQFVDQSQKTPVTHQYLALDEYERQQVFNLHTSDINGGSITQISFNQSHDRNPVVRPDGSIMFSRWEHVADRNRFTVFNVKQDGTAMFVLYGAHADGNSFLHPRDMDPNGPYAGYISSDLMPLDRTHAGGALMIIDTKDYTDQNTPINPSVPAQGGQVQATAQQLNTGPGPSMYGRVTTPEPLWDGTNRFLVAYTPCEVTNAGVVVSCATLSSAELSALDDPNRLTTQIAADPVQDNVPPSYAIYMFDPGQQTWLQVASPPAGYMLTNPVALQARSEPSAFTPQVDNPTLASNNPPLATLTVASVYDTDLLDRMGLSMLAPADLPTGCTTGIPQTAPLDPNDTRPSVANINAIKDPSNAAYNCAPLRFIRVVRAIAPPSGSTGERQAIGNTNFEQNEILGYAVVEPDGSFQINIPANTPVGFSVLDQQGRAFQVHTNWVQARPGEVRSCDGCHSPRKGAAINSGTIVNTISAGWNPTIASYHQAGDTMALTHANYVAANTPNTTILNNPVFTLQPNMTYADVWAATPTYTARASIQIDYSQLTKPGELAPVSGPGIPIIINYPDHIQPIWNANCASCHNGSPATLPDLSNTVAGTGRLASYEGLTVGPPVLANGVPVLIVQDGVQVVETGPALIYTTASESQAVGLARSSRLIEILSGQNLMADPTARSTYPTPAITASVPDHSKMLNASEMRLVTEWIDLGGKYYNDPFVNAIGKNVTQVAGLSQAVFTSSVYPILLSTCAANCHMARGSNTTVPPGTSFVDNKFVLTGDPTGDYNNTLTMISDTCTPSDPANYLLSEPSTIPHPTGATGQTVAVLPAGSAPYTTIANWIKSGCP